MHAPARHHETRRLCWAATRVTLVLAPFLIWTAVELLLLPKNFATFRAWEALTVMHERDHLPGRFYPSQTLTMAEAGDADPRGPRDVVAHWQTDRFGYRNTPAVADDTPYDVVLVGDSHLAGSRLTQSDTLGVVLSGPTGWSVYNHSHRGAEDLGYLLRDPRFVESADQPGPGVLVFQLRVIDLLLGEPRLPALPDADALAALPPTTPPGRPFETLFVLRDRWFKANALQWLRSRAKVLRPTGSPALRATERYPLARPGDDFPTDLRGRERTAARAASHAAQAVLHYQDTVARRLGCPTVVLLLPVAEPHPIADPAARRFVELLGRRGVPLVDLRASSSKFAEVGADLDTFFHPRDSHWTPAAVRWVAAALEPAIHEAITTVSPDQSKPPK